MIRTVSVVLVAMLLSGVLAAFVGYVMATGADTRLMLDVNADYRAGKPVGEQRAQALWESLEAAQFRSSWVYSPAVALIVGFFVGLTSRRWAWQLALAGVAPFAIIFSVGTHGIASGLPFLCLYLALAALSGWSGWVLLKRARAREVQ